MEGVTEQLSRNSRKAYPYYRRYQRVGISDGRGTLKRRGKGPNHMGGIKIKSTRLYLLLRLFPANVPERSWMSGMNRRLRKGLWG